MVTLRQVSIGARSTQDVIRSRDGTRFQKWGAKAHNAENPVANLSDAHMKAPRLIASRSSNKYAIFTPYNTLTCYIVAVFRIDYTYMICRICHFSFSSIPLSSTDTFERLQDEKLENVT